MLHHVELYVRDLERSRAFWTRFMSLLGYAGERWSQGVNYLEGEGLAELKRGIEDAHRS